MSAPEEQSQDELQQMKQWTVFKRLMSYTAPHKKRLTLAFFLLLIATAAELTGPILVKTFIDDYVTPRNFEQTALLILASSYIGLILISAAVNYIQFVLFQSVALDIIQTLRIQVFSKVHSLGLKFFDRTPVGSLVSRITNDTEAVKDLYVSVLSTFVQNIVFLFGIFGFMFYLNVKLALFCLGILPFIAGIMWMYRKYSSRSFYEMREKLSQLNAKLNESLQGMSIVQLFNQERRLRKEFAVINNEHNDAQIRNIKYNGLLLRPAVDLVYMLALLMILSFFGIKSFNSPVEIGVIYAFINYLDRFFEPVNMMMMRLSIFQQAIVSAGRVFTVMDEKEFAPIKEGNQEPAIQNGKIEFRNVTFSYDGEQEVLKNISFTALPGQTVALVGHTGSGKSSIINLLMRFYDVKKGQILIDDVPLTHFENKELREKVGLVLQDPFLFVGDIKQNIRMYNSEISDEDVLAAAQFVQASTFIEKLPDGFQTEIGERGATFSSGQRQLISFARTMAFSPKILILDEATANIDTETEEEIQLALQKMRSGRTTIAIAHRLSTIQDAELILVLHKGEIVERGTHQELLRERGLYHKMFLLQHGKDSMEEVG
ncbi:multidrug ABC transporter ATP-binding protein [Fictibacillus phosphorivorans]|uniref:Multidrug ABC transporter ATP-binding protein n=1 Tax=Fictibacillus phosphorivorans TaxID=1221500 RepID=A0A165NGI5_9BACL|nr:ABC transporter transmembrane domain-containing protein [Fictibacillus phosphorivorans]KZE65973.1 multidrug ABC transporter ATP-binding protein [Fictibacillus phosphorivorans]